MGARGTRPSIHIGTLLIATTGLFVLHATTLHRVYMRPGDVACDICRKQHHSALTFLNNVNIAPLLATELLCVKPAL